MKKYIFVLSLLTLSHYLWAKNFLPKSFQASYTQEYFSDISNQIKKTSGTLYYMRPGYLKYEVKSPDSEFFISNPKTTWLYTPSIFSDEPGQYMEKPTQDFSALKFFDILKFGLNSNKYYTVHIENLTATLGVKKNTQKKINIKEIILSFDKKMNFKNIKKIMITYNDNKKTTYLLKDISTQTAFKKDFFYFTPPKGAIKN